MSTRDRPLIETGVGLVARGKSNTPTETAVDVDETRGAIELSQTARQEAARDVTVTTKLTPAQARALLEELAGLVRGVDDPDAGSASGPKSNRGPPHRSSGRQRGQ